MLVESGLCTDDRGEGSEPVGAGNRQVLAVELAEAFLLAEPVELAGLWRRPAGRRAGELGVELQCRGTLGVAESSGDGVQVSAVSQELGGGVVPQLLERAGDADPAGVPAVPVGHRVGIPRRRGLPGRTRTRTCRPVPGRQAPAPAARRRWNRSRIARRSGGRETGRGPSPSLGAFSIRLPCLTM